MFDLPDEAFIAQSYWRVLGRPADPAGFSNYLADLRKGKSRIQVVRDLQSSPEASGRPKPSPDVPQVSSSMMLRPVQPCRELGGWRRLKRIRRIQEVDLLKLRGPLFVEAAFAVLLGRRPEQAELAAASAVNTPEERALWLRSLRARAPWHLRLWPREPATRQQHRSFSAKASPPGGQQGQRQVTGPEDLTMAPQHQLVPQPAPASQTAAFTIATRSYLPFVRVLMQSLSTVHPDFQCYVLLVEDSARADDQGPWVTVLARDLGIAQFDDMSVRYEVVELCTALKPMFFRWLLQTTTLQRLIYLDPDIRVYRPMTEVEQALQGGAALVLTPHIDAPLLDDGQPDTLTILKSGAFNLGFAALQRCEEADRFLSWWAQQLQTLALVSFEQNLFTDQRWCDLAPAFVPSLAVLRNRGYNVAYWNLPQRTLQRAANGDWEIDVGPLVFFHFSGFSPEAPQRLSKYQTRKLEQAMPALQPLLADYAEALVANGWNALHGLTYSYGDIESVRLSPMVRSLFRAICPESSGLSRSAILKLLLERSILDSLDLHSLDTQLSPLMRHLHSARLDLARVFDISTARGRADYADWFWSIGVFEHDLSSLVCRANAARWATGQEAVTSP